VSAARALYRAVAIAFWLSAAAIMLWAGLPDRARYTGVLRADGLRVAPEVGALAPPFRASTLDGDFTLTTPPLQRIVLNFWATWCIPCAVEMPELQRLHETDPEVRVVGVNLGESPEQVAAWAVAYKITFPLALDTDGQIARLYALRGQPTTTIIAPSGIIHAIFYGATDEASLRRSLAALDRTQP